MRSPNNRPVRGTNYHKPDAKAPPIGFTGRWGSVYMYRGKRWTGPSNLIGSRRIIRDRRRTWHADE